MAANNIICPITQCDIEYPVLADDNHLYEHAQILQWLEHRMTSPLTRQPISNSLVPFLEVSDYQLAELTDDEVKRSIEHYRSTGAKLEIARLSFVQPEPEPVIPSNITDLLQGQDITVLINALQQLAVNAVRTDISHQYEPAELLPEVVPAPPSPVFTENDDRMLAYALQAQESEGLHFDSFGEAVNYSQRMSEDRNMAVNMQRAEMGLPPVSSTSAHQNTPSDSSDRASNPLTNIWRF